MIKLIKKLIEPNDRDHHFKKDDSFPVAETSRGMPMIRKQNPIDLRMHSNRLAVPPPNNFIMGVSFPCLIGSLLVDITGRVTVLEAILEKTAGSIK